MELRAGLCPRAMALASIVINPTKLQLILLWRCGNRGFGVLRTWPNIAYMESSRVIGLIHKTGMASHTHQVSYSSVAVLQFQCGRCPPKVYMLESSEVGLSRQSSGHHWGLALQGSPSAAPGHDCDCSMILSKTPSHELEKPHFISYSPRTFCCFSNIKLTNTGSHNQTPQTGRLDQ